jgi:hypothetical protein
MIRIDGKFFVAGAVLENGVVVRCAPIIKYMMGWPRDRVFAYCAKRRWKAVLL